MSVYSVLEDEQNARHATDVAGLRADLAKAQARVAELESAVKSIWNNCGCGDGCANCERCDDALASDGTEALWAVRLAQQLVRIGRDAVQVSDAHSVVFKPAEVAAVDEALRAAFGGAP